MAKKQTSLKAFARGKDLVTCKVCQLPTKLRKEIHERPQQTALKVVVEWLKTLGHTITVEQLLTHSRGAHEGTPRRR